MLFVEGPVFFFLVADAGFVLLFTSVGNSVSYLFFFVSVPFPWLDTGSPLQSLFPEVRVGRSSFIFPLLYLSWIGAAVFVRWLEEKVFFSPRSSGWRPDGLGGDF